MKSTLFVALFVTTFAKYYHDLDDQQHIAMITESGINLSNVNPEAYMKITSNNGSTGYSWLIDTEACGITQEDSSFLSKSDRRIVIENTNVPDASQSSVHCDFWPLQNSQLRKISFLYLISNHLPISY